MRFLIDENLSEMLLAGLTEIAPGSVHLRSMGYGGTTDERAWQLAKAGGFTILTRDEDFLRLSILRGAPPKVVLVRLGNCPTKDVLNLLERRVAMIRSFVESDDASFLAIA